MKIIGIGQDIKDDKGKFVDSTVIVLITETEADQITGVAGKPHISGRYKPGNEINISKIYHQVERIVKKESIIRQAAVETKAHADDIINAFPVGE